MIWRSYLVAAIVALVALLWLKQMLQPGRPVYLVDFTCYKPPDSVKVTRNMCREYSERSGVRNIGICFLFSASLIFKEFDQIVILTT